MVLTAYSVQVILVFMIQKEVEVLHLIQHWLRKVYYSIAIADLRVKWQVMAQFDLEENFRKA